MGRVLVILKVYPDSIERNIDEIKEKVETLIKPEKIEIEDFVFGLKILKVSKIIEDEGGILEEIENKLKSIEGVQNVEVVHITRTI